MSGFDSDSISGSASSSISRFSIDTLSIDTIDALSVEVLATDTIETLPVEVPFIEDIDALSDTSSTDTIETLSDTSSTDTIDALPVEVPSTMAKAESSKAAASNGARANPNAAGGANYELPWYASLDAHYLGFRD